MHSIILSYFVESLADPYEIIVIFFPINVGIIQSYSQYTQVALQLYYSESGFDIVRGQWNMTEDSIVNNPIIIKTLLF